ncbi:TPA: cob(I)yrinic acid a,c-diamide adenosyltransferase [Candidatus Uhrbacteria bacterium]|nr:cob(I)yrinic acid a,c-diamide adenosyltransferase [Candidatus Uhrbacteria bacterium]
MPERELPKMDERIRGFQGYGLIQLIHGTGKGKTTAALGQAVRCAGAGKRVFIVYFDKGGETHYNERHVLDTIPNIAYVATGRDRIDPVTNKFDFSINEVDKSEAQRGIVEAGKALRGGEYDLVILDEINSTVDLGMVGESEIIEIIEQKLPTVEVILTGRNPPQSFVDIAHLVTEMKLERHYFYSGVAARVGLDY